MIPGYVIYVIDCETTGLDAVKNDVIEISACRLTSDEGSNYTREQSTWRLKALDPSTIEDKALAINGHNRDDIMHLTKFGKENYKEPADVISEIELWVMEDGMSAMDRVFVGQNPKFDIDALRELWRKAGSYDTFPFALENNNRVLDTKQIATLFDLCVGKRRRYYNLTSLVKSFGVKRGKAHQAAEDVRMTTDLLLRFIEPIKSIVSDNFSDCYID
jgi:DNA polymerase III epsilon subunit-like protein